MDHTTIYRWVQQYAPEIDKRSRPHLKQTNDSWRVNETYVKVKGQWMYLYRALDSTGQTLDFYFSQRRTRRAAAKFFRKILTTRPNLTIPRVINVDKHPAYISATRDMKKAKLLPERCRLRQSQYMNNLIEQDHRFMKWQIRPGLGFGSFPTAYKDDSGIRSDAHDKKGTNSGSRKGKYSSTKPVRRRAIWFRRVSQKLAVSFHPACLKSAIIICNRTQSRNSLQ